VLCDVPEDLRQLSVATRPLVGRPRNLGLFPGLGRYFWFFKNMRTASGHHQASSSYEYWGLFPRWQCDWGL